MSQQLVLRREDTEGALLSVLKALEIERTLGSRARLAALSALSRAGSEASRIFRTTSIRLRDVLLRRGVERPYTHQREAYDAARAGRATRSSSRPPPPARRSATTCPSSTAS